MSDVISFGSDGPRRPPRWLIAITLCAVVVAVVAFVAFRGRLAQQAAPPPAPTSAPTTDAVDLTPPSGPPCVPVGRGQQPAPTTEVAGLRLADTGSASVSCDRAALDGPWTVVVRRPNGSLGRHGAVVTFPVDPPAPGRPVMVGGVRAVAAARLVTWPVAGAHAQVRGDLSQADLIAIAAATKVVDDRPTVSPPAGLRVVASGPYRPPSIHELRYGGESVGEGAIFGGGLVYTGVTSGGGFEDRLFAAPDVVDVGPVDGFPAVVSTVAGGNATLAWEPQPGVVVYVGYSGPELSDTTIAALRRLATRSQLLDNAAWQATAPQTIDQQNDPS
ncbi:hypothetical protein [Asanoa ferruginea]|uniref:hypothetical protein n=1 Tax=Asanoa ferruginea TaxID=53367 RepID=UPI0011C11263|nr:hypothetical protein [Asanoa ferruginea]